MDQSNSITFLMVLSPSDDPNLLKNCLESIKNQSDSNFKTAIVLNGDLNKEHKKEIDNYVKFRKSSTITIQLPKTLPLSNALNVGLKYIDSEIVSRIDPDDECVADRVERTKNLFATRDIHILGSNIIEIDRANDKKFIRIYPSSHIKIKKMMLWNNQIAHSAVSFKLNEILTVGGYPDIHLQEDYALWLNCLKKGLIFFNDSKINSIMNVEGMLSRRSGRNFFVSEFKLMIIKINSNLYYRFPVYFSFLVRLIFRFMPSSLKMLFFYLDRAKNQPIKLRSK